ncbi:alpha/beta hydrolase [Leekyejoonella antrihumi]|uniref:Alpha/beta hydrolase n=1 Tax=Leekyejoonella antrihumi TaxID=1660198 RepID=A0A563DWI5_9MICO|nr:alpha/beta hydrolase [Leekyejoonella antrihumi]TWP34293.1 alpha/beta hydrolase [Leekyejoonella antrihumi]
MSGTRTTTWRTANGLVAGAAAIAMVTAGCSGGAGSSASAPSGSAVSSGGAGATSTAVASSGTPAALAKFYDQKLAWSDCGAVKCTKLTVPVSYAKPGGATIQIAVDKVPAKGHSKGALVVNPGGPGGSGYDYAAAADQIVTPQIRSSYDVVGFDPRGVGRSSPITCMSDAALDAYLGSDPTPDTKAEEQTALKNAKAFADDCKAKAGPLLANVSTLDVAKDLDILRAALGSTKLNYLGKSYGTLIGSTYAGLFPKRVGHFVLDGVVPPDITTEEMNEGQAEGFEEATKSYVKNCVAQSNCPLGTTESAGMARIRSFLKQVDAKPLPVSGQGDVRKLTEGWASMGIAEAMYSKQEWPTLTQAFDQAFGGDGTGLMVLADAYAERTAEGTYTGNIMQVINAVSCLDRPAPSGLTTYEKDSTTFAKVAPTWGAMLAWGSLVCGVWPIKPTGTPHKIAAAGSGPILVVGTTRDPATPYKWSVQLAKELKNGHLLTYVGDGHTAYGQSACIDDAVDAYLLAGTLPPKGKTC